MYDFIRLETPFEGEQLVVQRSEISSINSSSESTTSTIIMKNGTEFDVKGTAFEILDLNVGR